MSARYQDKKYHYIDRSCCCLLAVVFFYAGIPKLFHPVDFALTIEAYGMLPDMLVIPVSYLLPLFEVVLGLALLQGRVEGVWAALFLLISFILILSYALYLGLDIDCGCFGPEDPEQAAFSGIRTALIRDFLLLIPVIIPLTLRKAYAELWLPLFLNPLFLKEKK
ncbi:MauE/DoxX family redox-associated membrane protein [Desulfotalea psychrophila]|uniref:Related to methylamine utilization protein n=1 Tax=Desulfotalea psychrophila (strain LSv54 / DSM 12343) TaxID=177439 RepID=Q6APH9_DESPS|nr:MauE/DoxX family redox-associated membrane protein [Desulfotalea psychrophila]CAG35745.1 related to methylamine utilization protein [Desulfotalea psychrophila LSv54]